LVLSRPASLIRSGGLRIRNGAEVRARIIEAARAVVARQGVYNTTLQAIADEAGISKGALYYYYKSKDAILYDIMDTGLRVTTAMARRAQDGQTSVESLKQEIVTEFDQRLKKADGNRLHLYLALEALLGNQDLHDKYLQKYREWADRIEDILVGVHDLPRTPTLRAIAVAVLAAIDGFCIQELFGLNLVDRQVLLETGRLLLEGDMETLGGKLRMETQSIPGGDED